MSSIPYHHFKNSYILGTVKGIVSNSLSDTFPYYLCNLYYSDDNTYIRLVNCTFSTAFEFRDYNRIQLTGGTYKNIHLDYNNSSDVWTQTTNGSADWAILGYAQNIDYFHYFTNIDIMSLSAYGHEYVNFPDITKMDFPVTTSTTVVESGGGSSNSTTLGNIDILLILICSILMLIFFTGFIRSCFFKR